MRVLVTILTRTLGCAGLLVVYLIIFMLLVRLLWWNTERRIESGSLKIRYHKNMAPSYPVLVVNRDATGGYSARIMGYEKAKAGRRNLQDRYFTVPLDKQAELRRQVAAQKQTNELMPPGKFEVKPLSGGRQYIKVICTDPSGEKGPYIYASWYEASPRSISPKYYYWTRAFNTAVIGWLPYTFLWLIAIGVYIHWWKPRRVRRTAN